MTASARDFRISPELDSKLKSMRSTALGAGALGMLATVAGYFIVSPAQFFYSYFWTFVLMLGVTVGCLGWLMMQYLTGGNWGVMIRRVVESAAKTMPMWVVLFIPCILGIPTIFGHSWANATLVAHDPVLQHKVPFLNTTMWIIRGFVYLGGFTLLAVILNRFSDREDRDGISALKAAAKVSAPGLIFLIFAITFYSTDWDVAISAHWYSTMLPLLYVAGTGLSAIAFIIVMMVTLAEYEPLKSLMTHRLLHDIGKLMLANVMLWGYFAFSQYLITWAGNLPEEISFYRQRQIGGWQFVAWILILGHFALPFALLLSRDLKRNYRLIRRIAIFVILMRIVDVYWLVAGEYVPGHLNLHWMDLTALIGMGGLWFAYFLTHLMSRPLLPVNTPDLEEALAHGRE